jgi:putative RecB family exonuclease
MKKPVLHKSMIGMFDRCPKQYEFRYVEGIRIPPVSAMIAGTGVHRAAAKDLTAKRDTGKLLPKQAVLDEARDAVNSEWAAGVLLNDSEQLLGEKRARGETVDMAVSLAGLHHGKLAPGLEPKHIERPFTVELNGFPVDLSGTIDLQEASGTVRDLKTRSASPPEGLADSSLDLSMYGLAAMALEGASPELLAMDFLVKTKTPKLVTQTTTRGDGAYRAFLLRIEAVSHAIESGSFPPCSPENWCCSPRWCGYWSRCPFGAAARVTA